MTQLYWYVQHEIGDLSDPLDGDYIQTPTRRYASAPGTAKISRFF